MGKFKSMNKNIKKYGVKMGSKSAKQIFKKHIKKPKGTKIQCFENQTCELLNAEDEKKFRKQREASKLLKSSKSGKPKRQQIIHENRLRTNDLPLYENKKAQQVDQT